MSEIVVIAVAAGAALIGVAIGFFARKLVAANSVRHAEQYAERLVAEARAKQKEIVLEGKDEALHLRRAAEDEAREQRATLQRTERRLLDRRQGRQGVLDGLGRAGLRGHAATRRSRVSRATH